MPRNFVPDSVLDRLIDLVRQNRAIFDPSRKDHKDAIKITNTWNSIAEILNWEGKTDCGRHYTVSIALPGSIIDNAQSLDLCTYLAGQIGRAATVFNVDEIVVFDESNKDSREKDNNQKTMRSNGNVMLARILQFLECPQYLRKSLFPMHKDLKYAGLLNPIDSPHHMRASDDVKYREGIVLEKISKTGKSYANVGLRQGDITIDRQLKPGMRITVLLDTKNSGEQHKVVSPSVPRIISGMYWGYSVRMAPNLSSVLTQCPYNGGYDLTIGTSDKGHSVDEFKAPPFKHVIIVFGGIQGLEKSIAADNTLNIDDPSLVFQHYLNTCPNQGSRTIRTEDGIRRIQLILWKMTFHLMNPPE